MLNDVAQPRPDSSNVILSPVVIVGGTFDPIHNGHLTLALKAIQAIGANTAVLVVEEGHRHRATPHATLDQRRRLVQLAVLHDPALYEASQLDLSGSLADVTAALVARHRAVHVVFGADSARHLARWEGRTKLASAHIWAVPRSGDAALDIDGVDPLTIEVPAISATQVRFALAGRASAHCLVPEQCRTEIEHVYGPDAGTVAWRAICASA